jgi:hypothetical protein
VLKLVGQWMLSVYTLDYDIHFSLFPEEVIAEYILPSFEEAGLTYAQALEKIHRTANDTYGLQSLALSLHLRSNELLTGDDLVAYQKKLTRDYPELANTNAVTAVRKIQFSETNQAIPDEHFWVDPMDVITTFYAYEYNGRWYLDTEICLEDDLCIDLLAADPESSPWYKTKTWTGTVSVLNEDYIIMDGLALRIGKVPLPDGIKVGDTVTVTYHGLGATFLTEESDELIQTPEPEVSVYKLDRIDHVVEKDL